jgi:hypothetical protein
VTGVVAMSAKVDVIVYVAPPVPALSKATK